MQLLLSLSILFTFWGVHKVDCKQECDNPIIIHPKDTEIARRYFRLLDRDIGDALRSFDPHSGLLKVEIPKNAVISDTAVENLAMTEKKKLADDPKYIWSYRQSRRTAQLAGALAYAYSIKQSQYYKSPIILTYIKRIFSAFAKNQVVSGEFVFSPIHYSTVWGTHEMAWRLEPLICCFENVKSELSASERDSFSVVLTHAMQFLYTHENSSLSNRGVVWCGVMALCYRFTGDKKYLIAADSIFSWVGRLFNADGEIREGPGPDLGYSTVSLQYLFLYRIMSGNKSMDAILVKSLNWYTRLFSFHAIPFEGMTTRQWLTDGSVISNVMGALTFYADQDSSFAQIAARYLEALERLPSGFTLSHGSAYFLRGAQYHLMPKSLKEIPYQPYAQLYSSDHSLYFLYGNNYQTAVTLRGRKPLKGLQAWSYKGQPPLIFPSRLEQSQAVGMGFNSHLMDTPWDVSPEPYRLSSPTKGLDVLISATGALCTAFLFTGDITVVVYHAQGEKMTVDWVNYTPVGAQVGLVRDKEITFKDSDARIIFDEQMPSIIRTKDAIKFRFLSDKEYCWFAFAGPKSNLQVKPIGQRLILIEIEQFGTITKVVVNMSDESNTISDESLASAGHNVLFPYEAVCIE